MQKPNYQFEKRRKELDKKAKKEEKRKMKLAPPPSAAGINEFSSPPTKAVLSQICNAGVRMNGSEKMTVSAFKRWRKGSLKVALPDLLANCHFSRTDPFVS